MEKICKFRHYPTYRFWRSFQILDACENADVFIWNFGIHYNWESEMEELCMGDERNGTNKKGVKFRITESNSQSESVFSSISRNTHLQLHSGECA